MATNKHALIRYKTLDKCFSNPYRKYSFDDLKEEVEQVLSDYVGKPTTIGVRTLRGDINFMRSSDGYDAPIITEGWQDETYYRYEDPKFSIEKKFFTEEEKAKIVNAMEVFSRIKGLADFEWMEELATKLDNSINKEKKKEIICFEESYDLKGRNFVQPLYNYIKNEIVLKITYQGYTMEDPIESIFHPYYLKQYNRRWFLFGLDEDSQKILNFPLDRIQNIESTNKEYIENTTDWQYYFDQIVGVTNFENEEEVDVILEFSESRLPYVLSKLIHVSQGPENPQDGRIHLNLKINNELISTLLSYGSDVKVIAPEILKEKMKQKIIEMMDNYIHK